MSEVIDGKLCEARLCQHCLEYCISVEDLKPEIVVWIPQGSKDD